MYKPFSIEELKSRINSILRIQEIQKKDQIEKISMNFTKILSMELETDENELSFNMKCNEYKINIKEKEIIKLLLKGYAYKEISAMLNSTLNAVKKRIHTIYKKLNVQNKVELINLFKA